MKALYSIVVSKTVIDHRTNAATLVEVIESVKLEGLPSPVPPDARVAVDVSFVVLLDATESNLSPGDSVSGEFWVDGPERRSSVAPVNIQFQDGKRSLAIIQFQSLPFIGEGSYVFTLKCDDVLATWPVNVSLSH